MGQDDDSAYAEAAWSRFDAAVSDELLRAVTSAFALVAVADGDLAATETEQFLAFLEQRTQTLPALDMARVGPLFRDLSGALLSNPEDGRGRALGFIAAVKDNAEFRELVRTAAELALAADNRARSAEWQALHDICDALGLAPR